MTNNEEAGWAKIQTTQPINDLVEHGPSIEIGVMAIPFDGKSITSTFAQIDTGASGTGISPWLVKQLGLKPGDVAIAHEAGRDPIETNFFSVRLLFPSNIHIEMDVVGLPSLGGNHGILIGRDFLKNARVGVDFTTGKVCLHYFKGV